MEEQRPQRQQKPQKHYSKMEQDYITVCKAIRKAFPLTLYIIRVSDHSDLKL